MTGHGNASKNVVLVVVALILLGVAGAIVYQNFGGGSEAAQNLAALEKGRSYQQTVREQLREERFNAVSFTVGPSEPKPGEKVKIEVNGRVATQKDLDDLKKIVSDHPAPLEVVWNVTAGPGK